MSIGQELLDVPFPDMIYKMAQAIAQGQRKLDKSSLDTAIALSKARVQVIPDLYEIVEKAKVSDLVDTGSTLPAGAGDADTVRVRTEAAKPVPRTLMQAGLLPTFYQFTESVFEVGADFSVSTEAEAHAGLFGFGGSASVSTTFASHVNYKSSSTYDYSAEGSSLLRTTLKPVPPPTRIVPRIVTVDATVNPPKVTFGA